MKWSLTGGEGFIGSRFLKRMPDTRRWKPLIEYDVVVHLGALAGIPTCTKDPQAAFALNDYGTFSVLEDAREHGGNVVFASSAAAAHPVNPYAASKAAGEAWCMAYREAYNIPIAILRFGNVYGPGSLHKTSCIAQMCRDALNGQIIVEGTGAQERDFVYVENVVDVLLDPPWGGNFSVRTEAYYTIAYVAKVLADLSGAEIVHKEGRPGDVMRPRDAWKAFPMDYTPLEEGLEETWQWFKQHS